MAVIDVYNTNGESVSQIELTDSIYNVPVKTSVLHDVVTMQLAGRRSGTAKTKNRSEVSGSRRKLYKQKGTGRARRGDIKSPILRGGGVIFGPTPRSYAYKLPKKVRKLALKMALSCKLKDNQLTVLDRFELEKIRTKEFVKVIDTLKKQNSLIVIDETNETLQLSSRNVPGVKVLKTDGLNVYDILKYENLILIESSVRTIERKLQV
jgi:large subunit ribosomal protein L4